VINISQIIPCIHVVLVSLLVDILAIIVHLHLLIKQLLLSALYILRGQPGTEAGSFMPGDLLGVGGVEFQVICGVGGGGFGGLELPTHFLVYNWLKDKEEDAQDDQNACETLEKGLASGKTASLRLEQLLLVDFLHLEVHYDFLSLLSDLHVDVVELLLLLLL
jgi:hypothetical protein